MYQQSHGEGVMITGPVRYDSSYRYIEAAASAVAEGESEAGEQAAIELE